MCILDSYQCRRTPYTYNLTIRIPLETNVPFDFLRCLLDFCLADVVTCWEIFSGVTAISDTRRSSAACWAWWETFAGAFLISSALRLVPLSLGGFAPEHRDFRDCLVRCFGRGFGGLFRQGLDRLAQFKVVSCGCNSIKIHLVFIWTIIYRIYSYILVRYIAQRTYTRTNQLACPTRHSTG